MNLRFTFFEGVQRYRPFNFIALIFILSLFLSRASFANSLKDVRDSQLSLFGSAPLETIEAFDIACSAGEVDSCTKAEEMRSGEYFKSKKGFSALKSACKNGHAPSCMAQGLWEHNGIGTKIDLRDAKESYLKSCSAGHLPACYMGVKLNQTSQSKETSRSAMLELCEKGLDAGCVSQSDFIQRSDLTNVSQASGIIDPLMIACEGRLAVCDFSSLIGYFSLPDTKPSSSYLAKVSKSNSRKSIEGALIQRLKAARAGKTTAPEVVAVIEAFKEYGQSIHSTQLLDAAASVPAVLAALLDSDATQNTLDDKGRIALLNAAQSGQVDVVRALMAKGVSPNVRNGDEAGWTPLQLAAVENHVRVVEVLLNSGANPSYPNAKGWDPLMSAAKRGHTEVMQKLLVAGADFKRADSERKLTALHHASSAGQIEAAALLTTAGADLEAGDFEGKTALQYAIAYRDKDLVKLLLEQGSNVNRTLADGSHYLDMAIAVPGSDIETVTLILEAGANPNQRDKNGETPLFQAIRSDNQNLAEALLDNGADAKIANASGDTPLTLYAEIKEKRIEREATLERARQQKIVAQRKAEARRLAEAQRLAEKKKERTGLWGGLVGAAVGAAIGSEMGLGADQVGEFAQSFSKIGMAVEKGDAASLQAAQRDVDGLGARLEAAAPPKPINTYSNTPAQNNLLDDRFSPENLAASNAERNRIVSERNKANQDVLNGISNPAKVSDRISQAQTDRMANSDFKQYNLVGKIPDLKTCVNTVYQESPTSIQLRNSCADAATQNGNTGKKQIGSPNSASASGNALNYPGPESFTADTSVNESENPSGIDSTPPGALQSIVRGSYPPLTRAEYNELQERYGCVRPPAGCAKLVKSRYDSGSGQMRWKIENSCGGTVAYQYSLPRRDGTTSSGSYRTNNSEINIDSYPGRELNWEDKYLSLYGVGNSNVSRKCYNEAFRTPVDQVSWMVKERR